VYGWIWRHLPGPLPVRIAEAVAAVLLVVALLMFVVFPWVEAMLPFNQVTTQ